MIYNVQVAQITRQGFLASGLFWLFFFLKCFFLPLFPAVILLTLQVALVALV